MSNATRGLLTLTLYATLTSVMVSTLQSVWIGVTDNARYLAAFPRATGILYPLTLLTSILAGANCIMILQRKRWAIWLNIGIGAFSIVQLELAGGPRISEAVVVVACTITTVLPLLLWNEVGSAERRAHENLAPPPAP
jgi:hypothetical protein